MMRPSLFFLFFLAPFIICVFQLQANAAPAGPLVKHLSSLVKWTRSSSKTAHPADATVLQFEDGYLVETVVEGNELGIVPYSIRVSQDGELFAVDAVNSNIVKITPPLSQYSRAKLVAGSFQGHTGHVDGKPSDARFNHPKGVTMDDKGNVYVADTTNLAIRKIGEAGVTTIAGGKSNLAGYRDGPSEDAKFSSDFDVVYVRHTCSLLVIDRGNAALRQISLNKEDCDYENSSISSTDLLLVAGAIVIGYATCMLQQGVGSAFFSKMQGLTGTKLQNQPMSKDISKLEDSSSKDEQQNWWPSFKQLLWDLCKLAPESLSSILIQFIPLPSKGKNPNLTPLKDSLIMPGDEPQPPTSLQKHKTPPPFSEIRHNSMPIDRFTEVKQPKLRSSTSFKDPEKSSKHRSSRRQEFAEFYGSTEVQQVRATSQKERTKRRPREKSGEVSSVMDQKPAEVKPTSYDNPKYDGPYNFRSKYGEAYRNYD